MSQIKQLLRLHQQGRKYKAIARDLGMSKNTVKSYLSKVSSANWSITELLHLDDPVLEAKFHAGNPAYKDERYDYLKARLDYYAEELKKTGVTKLLLWEEYLKDAPDGYGRSQFGHHLLQHIRTASPSMTLSHLPGQKLMVDFAGKKLSYVDKSTGEVIECQVFVACLPYSDYGFAMAVHTQCIADFIHALWCCLIAIGGSPKVIVPDNLKSAITLPSRYEAGINRVMEDFANHYGITVLPARVRKPKDKALVENQVKLVYNRVYARLRNQLFFSLEELNHGIAEKMKLHNQTRMQEKSFCREACFLSEEKPLLLPLPETHFEIKTYKTLKVAQNNHIRLTEDKRHYSVPYQYIGQRAQVIYTRSLVRIYINGKQVATHIRNHSKPGYSTEKNHLCSAHQHYLNRSPDYYIAKAKEKSETMEQLFTLLFQQDRYPEQLYRTCDGLLILHRKAGTEKLDKACQIAINNENYSYQFIHNILNNNMIDRQQQTPDNPLPQHPNIRGEEYYKQLNINL